MTYVIAIMIIITCIGGFFWWWRRKKRRARRMELIARPISQDWLIILEQNIPLYRRLPENLKEELHGHLHVFLDEKNFEGAGGLTLTDQIRVTIAGHACMLLLGREAEYFPGLYSIIVYPSAYVVRETRHDGLMATDAPQIRLGEAWHHGAVILSWDDVLHGARDIKDGHNVALHEFAHQLDFEDGSANGAPILDQQSHYVTWARVLGGEYAKLQKEVAKRHKTVLDAYGSTNPAEFFAVLTETFFEKPRQLKKKHPALYEEMQQLFKIDPVSW